MKGTTAQVARLAGQRWRLNGGKTTEETEVKEGAAVNGPGSDGQSEIENYTSSEFLKIIKKIGCVRMFVRLFVCLCVFYRKLQRNSAARPLKVGGRTLWGKGRGSGRGGWDLPLFPKLMSAT